MMTTSTKQERTENRAVERALKKMRGDSKWNGLTFEQCQTVERWLFEDNLSYAETAERVKKEFGMETSLWSVARFFRHRARMRQSIELLEAQLASDQLSAMPASTEEMRATTLKLVAKSAIRLATEKPDAIEKLLPLSKVLLAGELNEIRLRKVKLEERYCDFETNAACAKDLEKARAYIRTVGDNENLSEAEKHQRIAGLLFGKDKVSVEEAEAARTEDAENDTEAANS